MYKVVLLRHGQSTWNLTNRFTGWVDVSLSKHGKAEVRKAARALKDKGYDFDIAFTSVLERATQSLNIILKELKHEHIPVKRTWKLNERHYGALEGLYKQKTAEKFGDDQVYIWRRSYDVRPPALKKTDKYYPGNFAKYKNVLRKDLPLTECLKDVEKRVLPYWKKEIVPKIKAGKRVLISAHGNSLRALVRHLDKIPKEDIERLNIPTGFPLVYELDKKLKPIRHYYLGDKKEYKKAVTDVFNQGKALKH